MASATAAQFEILTCPKLRVVLILSAHDRYDQTDAPLVPRGVVLALSMRWSWSNDMKCTSRWVSVLLTGLVAVLACASQTAQAQVTKPFKITGEGVLPEGLSLAGFRHCFVGVATHMGLHAGQGLVQIDSVAGTPFNPDGSITGTFESNPAAPCVFVAANGDKLVCTYGIATGPRRTGAPGTYKITPVGPPGIYVTEFVAEFVPTVASTGKFAEVQGSWVMVATTPPFVLGATTPVPYGWSGEGSLTFKKGN